MFHEYPKCVYQDGSAEAPYRVVMDAADEAQARDDGFVPVGESPEKARRKYERKAKQ
jgi:hypothetical protein